jgi:pimeloyl-ACP methyl ester carboxylesterase
MDVGLAPVKTLAAQIWAFREGWLVWRSAAGSGAVGIACSRASCAGGQTPLMLTAECSLPARTGVLPGRGGSEELVDFPAAVLQAGPRQEAAFADEPCTVRLDGYRSGCVTAEAAMSSAPASSQLLYFTERGSGPPLLLVHGLMVTGEMFEPVTGHLATRHRVIIPDLRGHGRSSGLPPPYTAAQLAGDLSHLLDQLGVDSAAVLGYSQGGAIAQQLALDHPTRCDRLVLACTYAFNMATPREWLEGHLMPLFLHALGTRGLAKLVVSQAAKQLGKERAGWLAGLIADQDRTLMGAAWRETMTFDSRRRLAEIACPTLVLAASDDRAVPIHHARMLHEGIPGAQLVIINGADHALIWTHPGEFLQVTDEFLRT